MSNPTIFLARSRHGKKGFALVIALSLMAFILLLLMSITTLVRVETQSSRIMLGRLEAEQAALLGLNLALGDLQKHAGADQRVTATADILSNAADGNKQWVGVWNTEAVDRFDPAGTRSFSKWLVSTSDSTDASDLTLSQTVIDSAGVNGVRVFDGVDETGDIDDAKSVNVQLVEYQSHDQSTNAYAYWVEDDGVKAKASWNESEGRVTKISNDLTEDALQSSRLSSLVGVDLAVFGGEFSNGLEYPLNNESNYSLYDKINRVTDYNQLAFLAGDAEPTWLDRVRHDLTANSYGLLTDVKNGGFKKDLSLAFEMDDAVQIPEQATLFNSTTGDFAGGGDRSEDSKSAIAKATAQSFYARYLFAETTPQGVVRGPTWHSLRDYYNFYKRIRSTGTGYEFDIQPFYPNSPEFNSADNRNLFHGSRFAFGDDGYANEFTPDGAFYRYMPTRGNYAPVLLGSRMAFTVKVINWDAALEEGDLALVFDPFFYVWNPYDQAVKFENFKIKYDNQMPIVFKIEVDDPKYGGSYEARLDEYVDGNFSGLQKFETFLNDNGEDVTIPPGGVVVFSSRQVGTTTESWPGPQLTDSSGITFALHPSGNQPIKVTRDGSVDVTLSMERVPGFEWFITNTFSVDDDDYASSAGQRHEPASNPRMQMMYINLASPLDANSTWSKEVTLSDISVEEDLLVGDSFGFKYPIGYFDDLMKATNQNGDGSMYVAPFAHFNPTAMMHMLQWRWVPPNRFSYLKAEPNLNSMLPQTVGVGRSFWGKSYSSADNVSSVPVREIPTSPIVSLAALSGAEVGSYVFDPVRVIGSSNPIPTIPLDRHYYVPPSPNNHLLHDSAWLANDSLWDSYFFSGIVPNYSITGAGYSSVGGGLKPSLSAFFDSDLQSAHLNARIQPFLNEDELDDVVDSLDPSLTADGYRNIGQYVVLDGAFNVNSTSVDAWAAILGANRSMDLQASDGSNVSPAADNAPFPKNSHPQGSDLDAWEGYASLDEVEIGQLAAAIVDEVRLRGPFMSLADFVNRRLTNGLTGEKGALQAAIDTVNVNSGVAASSGTALDYSDPMFPDGGSFNGDSSASAIAGYLMQADVLRSIGSTLTARSDTFRITSHGESRDPITGDKIIVRCEARVQRLPTYVDLSNNPTETGSELSATNTACGRRFKLISFNWTD